MAQERIILQEGMRDETFLLHGPDGHSYHFNKEMKGGRLYYRCFYYYRSKCKGACSVDPNDGSFRRCGGHRHQPPEFLIHERRLRHAVLNRCRSGDLEHFKSMYHQERRRLRTPPEAVANMPFYRLRPAMERARAQGMPPIPHSLSELGRILRTPGNEYLTETLDKEDNIFSGIVGSSAAGTRCIILMSRRGRQNLARAKRVFTDATFVAPPTLGCAQVWNIVTVRRSTHPTVIHLLSVLMQSRTAAAYRVAIQAIRQLVPQFQPTEILSDFEHAEMSALHSEFGGGNCEIHGCLFHHTRAVSSNVKELGFIPLLRQNVVSDSIVRSLCAIPLLPKGDMVNGFLTVLDRAEQSNQQELAPVFDYYQRTWLIPSRLRHLSVHQLAYRTTNAVESFNDILRTALRRVNPNVYQLLHAFVEIEDVTVSDINVLQHGGNVSKKRRVSALWNDTVIRNLTADLQDGDIDIGEFLRNASRRIQGVYDNVLH